MSFKEFSKAQSRPDIAGPDGKSKNKAPTTDQPTTKPKEKTVEDASAREQQ